IDVTLEGSGADAKLVGAGGWVVPLPRRLAESVAAQGVRKIIAGFRPEHLDIGEGGDNATAFQGKADVVEYLGNEELLHVTAANQDIVAIVGQSRVPAGRVLLEIPAGTLDIDEATGAVEDHALAARRELEEETGYRAGTWRQLASFWTAPGFATELMHLWLATDLRPADGERPGPD